VSPLIHSQAAEALGLHLHYLPLDVAPESLEEAVAGLRALGFRGCNVTIPHKEKVLEFAGYRSGVVDLLGAANTLTFTGGKVVADNTDWAGFLRAWEERDMGLIGGGSAVVLGAGGAARAVIYAMLESGLSRLHLFNRDVDRAGEVLNLFRKRYPALKGESYYLGDREAIAASLAKADILINATPVGMYPASDAMPLDLPGRVNGNLSCYDLVYNPLKSRLLAALEKKAVRVSGGLGMLIHQAALSFELWTGRRPDLERMRIAARGAICEMSTNKGESKS
jgi:shikimate dehydrogenase